MVGSGTIDESEDVDYVDNDYSIQVTEVGGIDDFEEVTDAPISEKAE